LTSENWATLADLATALGTLVLAVATFSAVRSGNRTARVAEQSLLTSLRPLLMPSKLTDEPLKVNFGDNKWVRVPGGNGVAQIGGGDGTLGPSDGVMYLVLSLRNVGSGIAVLHGWRLSYERGQPNDPMPALSEFTLQTRDMYIPVADTGFWQGAIRDPADPRYEMTRKVIESRGEWYVDLLYGDHEGGQRAISRFRCQHRPVQRADRPSAGRPGTGRPGGRRTPAPGWPRWPGTGPSTSPDPRSGDRAAVQLVSGAAGARGTEQSYETSGTGGAPGSGAAGVGTDAPDVPM
jgi:hypothetical protein